MSYLIDTNAISELTKPSPNPDVVGWFKDVPAEHTYISAITVGELRKGIEKLHDAKKKEILRRWLEINLTAWFEDRILPIDAGVADRWGRLIAQTNRSLPAIDSLIAATCLRHDLRLVTRNIKDFHDIGVEVVNPWVG